MTFLIDLRPLLSNRRTGVENVLIELTERLIKNSPEHHFILWSNTSKHKVENPFTGKNIEFIQTRIPNTILNLTLSFLNFPKIDFLINKKIDHILQFDLRPISSSKNYSIYTLIHDLSFIRHPNFFSKKSQIWFKVLNLPVYLKKVKHIFTVSNFSKSEIHHLLQIPSNKISVIYPGVNFDFLNHKKNLPSNRYWENKYSKYFLCIGSLEPRKNLARIISAFEIFSQKHPDFKLLIAGIGNSGTFKKVILKENPNVILLGYVDEKEKYELYKQSFGLIYCSLYEGFGLPIIEAAHTNIPIITSNTTSLDEIAPPQALKGNPNDINKISENIEKSLSIKTLDYVNYLEKFNWNNSVKTIIKIVNQQI